MNTNPDDATLAMWLDDELQGEEFAAVNAWAEQHPEQLAAREEIRRWRRMIASALPASEEPPAAEFFNARIAHSLAGQQDAPAAVVRPRGVWRSILMPLASCAGMVFAFWLGSKMHSGPPEIDVAGAPKAIPVEPIIYTPDRGVKAEWFANSGASATVIILDGVDAIPDSMDFSATAATQRWSEAGSTAGVETEESPDL